MPIPEHLELDRDAPEDQAGRLRPKQGANRCPECGHDLTGQDPKLHSLSHYPPRWDPNNPPSQEARKRREMLENMQISSHSESEKPL